MIILQNFQTTIFLGIQLELKKLPPAYGIGKFMATMHLYKTDQYLETYQSNPQLNTGDYLNVGEYFVYFFSIMS